MKNKIIKFNLLSFYIALGLLLFPNTSRALRDIPDDNLAYPVLVTTEDGTSATGFYINHLNRIYFITAKHVIFKEPENILRSKSLTLLSYPKDLKEVGKNLVELNMEKLQKNGMVKKHNSQDVASVFIGKADERGGPIAFNDGLAMKIQSKSGIVGVNTSETIKLFRDVLVGNEVLIFGYPTSLGIKEIKQIQHDKPLIRKGIVAGKNSEYENIIIDCPTYPGNSGGPVIEKEQISLGKCEFKLIGLISQFVPFEEIWLSKRFGLENRQWQNSGYSIVVPVDTIMELIKE